MRILKFGTGDGPPQKRIKIEATAPIMAVFESTQNENGGNSGDKLKPSTETVTSGANVATEDEIHSQHSIEDANETNETGTKHDMLSPTSPVSTNATTTPQQHVEQRLKNLSNCKSNNSSNYWAKRSQSIDDEAMRAAELHQVKIASLKQQMRHREKIFRRKIIYWDALIARNKPDTIATDTATTPAKIVEPIMTAPTPRPATATQIVTPFNWNYKPTPTHDDDDDDAGLTPIEAEHLEHLEHTSDDSDGDDSNDADYDPNV